MPRFVLLYHNCPPNYERPSHWDFMLEAGATLRTWALERLPRDWRDVWSTTAEAYPDCPPVADGHVVAAISLGDHRLDYLEFEGPLGGDRGTVIRVAAGTYRGELEASTGWQVTLEGKDLRGTLSLRPSNSGDAQWTLTCSPAG